MMAMAQQIKYSDEGNILFKLQMAEEFKARSKTVNKKHSKVQFIFVFADNSRLSFETLHVSDSLVMRVLDEVVGRPKV